MGCASVPSGRPWEHNKAKGHFTRSRDNSRKRLQQKQLESVSRDYNWAAALGQEEGQSTGDRKLGRKLVRSQAVSRPTSHQAVSCKFHGIQRPPTKHKPVNLVKNKD